MKLQGEIVKLSKSAEEVYNFLIVSTNYEQLMPENLTKFEPRDTGFKFGSKGMPEIALKFKETTPNSKVVLTAAGSTLTFDLNININPVDATSSTVLVDFEGQFNPMVKMMVEKPLTKFMGTLSDNIKKIETKNLINSHKHALIAETAIQKSVLL